MSDASFDAVVNVHLTGLFTCVHATIKSCKTEGAVGRIACIGSATWQRGNLKHPMPQVWSHPAPMGESRPELLEQLQPST